MSKFVNVSNLAAIGCEVIDDDGTVFQLAVPRGVRTGVLFAVRSRDGHRASETLGEHAPMGWSRASYMTAPERFGGIPDTYAELLRFARLFQANKVRELAH